MSQAKSIYNQENTYICEVCGKEFKQKTPYSTIRFCSTHCKNVFINNKPGVKEKKRNNLQISNEKKKTRKIS